MCKKFLCSLSLLISLASVANVSFAETNVNKSHQNMLQSSGENILNFLMPPANAAEKGACIYTTGPTQVCKDDVTESWCKQQPNYQWASNTKCP